MGQELRREAAQASVMKYKFLNYHKHIFSWHCRHFFNFEEHMTKTELDYLDACFHLTKAYVEVSETGFEHFSFFTYSHRVKGTTVNSSRIAYGSVAHPDEAWEPAKPVLKERDIVLPPGWEDNRFYGLGWDIEKGQFKVYFRTLDWRKVPPDLSPLIEGYSWDEHRGEALISMTYEGNEVVERKVYLYPKEASEDERIRGKAKMITSRRGEVMQDDLAPEQDIPYELNETGQKIVDLYDEELEEELDTIAFKNSEDFTLYFP